MSNGSSGIVRSLSFSFLKDVYFSKEEDTTPPYFWLTQARNDTSENNRGRSLDQIDGENITATKDDPIKIEFTVNDSPDAYEAFAALVTNEETDNPNQYICLLYTSPSPRDRQKSRMPSSA